MENLLTIEDIAIETGLEESLLRFYESEYPDRLPEKVVKGGSLLFEVRAVDVFRKIHGLHAADSMVVSAKTGRYARVIAVTSGKGGVGKSNIALNLAIEFQRLGKMSLVLDADMGMANIHLLTGLTPGHGLAELAAGRKTISEVVVAGPEGIGIIPGVGGVLSMADCGRSERLRIAGALARLEEETDIILIDTAAGMAAGVRDFLKSADELLFVLTPDITSLADAYGLLKALHHEGLPTRPLYCVINMALTVQQAADVARRFIDCSRQFLGRTVEGVGYLLKDATVGAALVRRTPYTVFNPQARVSRNTANLAAALLKKEQQDIPLSSAFGRFQALVCEHEWPKNQSKNSGAL